MQINKIYLKEENLCVSYNLEIVNENFRLTATFFKDGKQIYKARLLRSFEMLAKLKDRDFAVARASKIFSKAKKEFKE